MTQKVVQVQYKKIIRHDNDADNKENVRSTHLDSYLDLPRGREVKYSMVTASGAMQR